MRVAHILPYAALLAMAGCASRREEDSAVLGTGAIVETGAVKGRTCDPWTGYWLADGEVYTYLYEDNEVVDLRFAYSDREGFWLLDDLPAGEWYQVYVQKWYTMIEEYNVHVDDEKTVDLTLLYDESDYCLDSRGQVYDP